MNAAAGAAVAAGNLHDPHRPGQRPLGAVKHVRQLLRAGDPALYREIAPDGFVQFLFQGGNVLRRDHTVKIHGDKLRAHMVALIMVAVAAVDQAGEHMLTGVLLHQVEPPIKVDDAFNLGSGLQRAFAQVDHLISLFLGIPDPDAV